MADTGASTEATSGTPSGLGVDTGLEVVTLPVSDVDRAKRFYASLGWRLDIDPPNLGSDADRSYFARARFSDPDGNGWQLQEITSRLPDREWED